MYFAVFLQHGANTYIKMNYINCYMSNKTINYICLGKKQII